MIPLTFPALSPPEAMGVLRIGLVGCSKSKLDRAAPARDLYTSDLFRLGLAVAEATCHRVFVLSAKHGALQLEDQVEPYDVELPTDELEVLAWNIKVIKRLTAWIPSAPDPRIRLVFFAGAKYVAPFRKCPIEEPLARLQTGQRRSALLAYLRSRGLPIPPLGGSRPRSGLDPAARASIAGQLGPQLAARAGLPCAACPHTRRQHRGPCHAPGCPCRGYRPSGAPSPA